jgi:hypothetical protein
MEKKSGLLLVVILFLVLPLVHSGSNALYDSNTPKLKATLLSQSPDPVEPGQIVVVKFKIENEGIQTKDNVYVKLISNYPFEIYGDSFNKNIGKLKTIATGADALIVEYKLKVDEDAVEGESELELELNYGETGIKYIDNQFMVDIQTHDAVLEITSVSLNPERVVPGEESEIIVIVKNLADSLLKDIKFKLDFDDENLPLAPYKSSSERRISKLNSGFQDNLNFNIIADPGAKSGLYKVPLKISYKDEKGKNYSVNDILAVTIGDTPKVKPFIKRSTVLQSGKEGKVTISLANSGITDVKFLELFILPSKDYQLISTTDYFYIGDIDSDDTESEEINIYVNKNVEKLNLPLRLKYRDANNKDFQQVFDLEMNLFSESQLKKFGVIEASNYWIYFIILVLVAVGYYWYRKNKKNNQKS